MMVYLFFACKNKLWRIPIVIAAVLFYVAIAMEFTRTVKLITSVSAAMLLILLAYKYLPLHKLWQKAAVLVLCAALMIPLTFKSFDWTNSLMSQVSSVMISETGDDGEDTAEGVDLSDSRNLTEDISNLSERSQIYASFIPSLKVRPLTILIGNFSDKLMNIPNMFVDFPVPFTHMHNFLLEVFMLTGLPGFLLVVAFCLILVVNMVKLFFTQDKHISLAAKTLTIPVTGILLYGMFEIVIFTECADQRAPTDMRELSFFILAAAALAYCNDRKCK
jgi:O-antigen ligase